MSIHIELRFFFVFFCCFFFKESVLAISFSYNIFDQCGYLLIILWWHRLQIIENIPFYPDEAVKIKKRIQNWRNRVREENTAPVGQIFKEKFIELKDEGLDFVLTMITPRLHCVKQEPITFIQNVMVCQTILFRNWAKSVGKPSSKCFVAGNPTVCTPSSIRLLTVTSCWASINKLWSLIRNKEEKTFKSISFF